MWIYSFVMLFAAALLISVGVQIYKGNTQLIHSYHQSRVTDKEGYGRAMGRAVILMGSSFNVSGLLPLIWRTDMMISWSLCVMIIGIAAGTVLMVCTQKKYNKGIF